MRTPDVRLLDEAVFTEALARARNAPRLRTNHDLHAGPEDAVHRFLNVMRRGTYVTPHRHVTPPKTETFLVLRGSIAVFLFEDDGSIRRAHVLGDPHQRALPCCIDLSPGLWHALAVLSDEAICFEVKPGPWEPATDKDFAPFAPREGVASPEACTEYLEGLLRTLEAR